MKTRKEAAQEARVAGLKQFVCEWIPCSVCGGTVFFTASSGCKHCVYERTRARRSTAEYKEKMKQKNKEEWLKNKNNPEFKAIKKERDREFHKKYKKKIKLRHKKDGGISQKKKGCVP